jgi:hypothetical protein
MKKSEEEYPQLLADAKEAYGGSGFFYYSNSGDDLVINKKLNDDNIHYLNDILVHSSCRITSLCIGSNNIGDKGARDLVIALEHPNCKLIFLDLGSMDVERMNMMKQLRAVTLPMLHHKPIPSTTMPSICAERPEAAHDKQIILKNFINDANSISAFSYMLNGSAECMQIKNKSNKIGASLEDLIYRLIEQNSRMNRLNEITEMLTEDKPALDVFAVTNSLNQLMLDRSRALSAIFPLDPNIPRIDSIFRWVGHKAFPSLRKILFNFVLKKEFSGIKNTLWVNGLKLSEKELSRLTDLFRTMVELDGKLFMDISMDQHGVLYEDASNGVNGFNLLHSVILPAVELLLDDKDFRVSTQGFNVFKHFLMHYKVDDNDSLKKMGQWWYDYKSAQIEELKVFMRCATSGYLETKGIGAKESDSVLLSKLIKSKVLSPSPYLDLTLIGLFKDRKKALVQTCVDSEHDRLLFKR